MSQTIPTRIDSELFAAAKAIGAIESRTATQQLSYWARIGRELEASPGTSPRDIQRVLAGEPGFTYDRLADPDQALVRAAWDEQLLERAAALDLADRFRRAGRSWSEADEAGNLVERDSSEAAGAESRHASASVKSAGAGDTKPARSAQRSGESAAPRRSVHRSTSTGRFISSATTAQRDSKTTVKRSQGAASSSTD